MRSWKKAAAFLLGLGAVSGAIGQVSPGGILFFGDRVVRESVPSTAPIVQLECGLYTATALRADGTVVAWGDNSQGRAMVPANLTGVKQIANGFGHTLALKKDGTVVAWGLNSDGQANVPTGLSNVKSVWAGAYMSFAIKNDGTFAYWGSVPTPPSGLSNVAQFAVGETFVIARKNDGTLVHWGDTGNGNLVPPAGLTGVVQVATNKYHSLALKSDGTVVAFGHNLQGENNVPAGLNQVVQVAVGGTHSLALRANGSIVGWGSSSQGQFAIATSAINPVHIAAGGSFSLALQADGKVVGSGESNYSQSVPPYLLGATKLNGSYGNFIGMGPAGKPVYWGRNDWGQANIPGSLDSNNVKSLAVGYRHGMALTTEGGVYCWGGNQESQLNVPASVSEVTQISAGKFHSVAFRSPTALWCWGWNSSGQTSFPANLGALLQVSAGDTITSALKSDGTVVVWGDNFFGARNVPAGLSGVTAIATGIGHTVALKSDGTVAAWGWNSLGQSNVPSGVSNVVQISAGDTHSVYLRNDGTVGGWGGDNVSQIGLLGTVTNAVKVIGSGNTTACVLKMHVSVAPWQVTGGESATGTVYLANPAPAGGTTVTLSSSDPCAAVPGSVVVPAGATSVNFTVATTSPAATTQPMISATLGTLTQKCLLTVEPAPLLLTLTRSSVVGGSTTLVKGTVKLLNLAPAGGAVVTLNSSSAAGTVPSTVTIPAGKNVATFKVTHSRVSTAEEPVIGASYSSFQSSASLAITPFQVSTLAFASTTVFGGSSTQMTITLNAPTENPVDVAVASSDSSVVTGGTFTVPAGAASLTAPLFANGVSTTVSVNVSATLEGTSKVKTLKVFQGLTSLKFDTPALYGNGSVNATVTLPAPAPAGGWAVTLVGTNCVVPTTVTVPQGTSSLTFPVIGADVSAASTATLQAAAGGSSLSVSKALSANLMLDLTADPMTFVGGSSTVVTGTVTLKAPVAVDTVVALSSLNPGVLSVPSSVTIAAGSSSASFTISHQAVAAPRVAKINAQRLGFVKTLKLTVN